MYMMYSGENTFGERLPISHDVIAAACAELQLMDAQAA